ncbi:D-amino-acid transaminase [Salsuginibacillus kocurii]|uniref:D-amino-acid transaminase n=1 Tax=Salsuginibacillus kocurii TaxID=427078 RepID=UPI00037F9D63|nr:D-amino-acid transaminase [Salsuginibacillus kocurii]
MPYVLVNQEIVPEEEASISVLDRSYLFGDGVYEVIRIYNGLLFAAHEHMTRLARSANELDIPLPYSQEEWEDLSRELVQKNNITEGYIYIQLSRGQGVRNHLYERYQDALVTAFTRELPASGPFNSPVTAFVTPDIRWLRCDIKTVNLLGNVMAKRKAADHHAAEAIQHRDGIITEGSSANVFLVKDNVIYTHPANHYILNGITRQLVLKVAEQLAFSIKLEAFTTEDLLSADEVFLTSTSLEVTPVKNVRGDISTSYGDTRVADRLQEAFNRTIPGRME